MAFKAKGKAGRRGLQGEGKAAPLRPSSRGQGRAAAALTAEGRDAALRPGGAEGRASAAMTAEGRETGTWKAKGNLRAPASTYEHKRAPASTCKHLQATASTCEHLRVHASPRHPRNMHLMQTS